MGGVLIGFISVWAASYMVGSLLGEASAERADGGLWSLSNLAFFLLVETAIGLGGGFLAVRMDGPGVLGRLAAVILFGGVVISVLAADVPGVQVSAGSIFFREALHATGVGLLAYLLRSKSARSDLPAAR
jgi:hypothetical protein